MKYTYQVYGVSVSSPIPLELPTVSVGNLAEVQFDLADASYFSRVAARVALHPLSDDWYQYAFLADDSVYVSWTDVGRFVVSADGRRIICRPSVDASSESFQVYMLGQALSFALVKLGFEPLHSTAVVIDNSAAAFLGAGGFGKSTLAACFLSAGYRILTDDLLLLEPQEGVIVAFPGPPRIKLFPGMAREFLKEPGGGVVMNSDTTKLIFPLQSKQACQTSVALRRIYAVAAPNGAEITRHIGIEQMSSRDGVLTLLASTFNRRLTGRERLGRQFASAASLLERIPVRRLSYPRVSARLHDVREAILSDFREDPHQATQP